MPKNEGWKMSNVLLKHDLKFETLDSDPKRKPKKVLTNVGKASTLKTVKAKRKDNTMASAETKKSKGIGKTIAWTVFAAQQGFVGYLLLAKFDNYVVMVAAGMSLLMAVSVVLYHMYQANR